MAATREDGVYMAKLVESGNVDELTVEERNLFSVAYKNIVRAQCALWWIVFSIKQKETRGNGNHVFAIKDYRAKIEAELSSICGEILNLLEKKLVPSSSSVESKVFYLKMKDDYHGCLAECNRKR